jgi:serine/threonine-protein kinase RsbW
MPADVVSLSLPCTPEHARVARTTAAAFGAMAGFSIDGLDDLRLLVDEVFGAMGTVGVRRVDLCFARHDEGMHLEVAASAPVASRGPPPDTRIAVLLAAVLAADVRINLDGTRPTFEATIADRR